MEKKFKHFAGIDISKQTFDFCTGPNSSPEVLVKSKFSNKLKGFDKLERWLLNQGINFSDLFVCIENTGIYHRLLVQYLQSKGAFVWVETPVQITWSGGILRGKTDDIDSERIQQYGYRYQDKAKEYESKDEILQQLSDYLSLRSRLQDCLKSLEIPIKELESIGLKKEATKIQKASEKSRAALKKELKELEKLILNTIKEDEELYAKYEYTSSVDSIGFIASVYLLVKTNGFKKFKNHKQLSSYIGTAPFEYSSGTSIRGKTKVHFMGDKKLKSIMHMCALCAIKHNDDIKAYYLRKVAEGKNKMLVINNIKNKLLARVFSCVLNERTYQKHVPA